MRGEISVSSDMQMTPESELRTKELKSLFLKVKEENGKRRVEKLA